MDYNIRPLRASEYHYLEEFTYQAIFQRNEYNIIPRTILSDPALKVYYDNFGKTHDHCLVAEINHDIVGAVWTRILSGSIKGFGNIDHDTPEFGIALFKEFRGQGIGTALMNEMISLLQKNKYSKTSLAVQKDNYAVRMYLALGFIIIRETQEEYIMLKNHEG